MAETRRKLGKFLKYNKQSHLARMLNISDARVSQFVREYPDAEVIYVGNTVDRVEYTLTKVIYSIHHKGVSVGEPGSVNRGQTTRTADA